MAAPGWYKDPGDAPRLRYWNGDAWTGSTIDAPSTVAPGPDVPPPLPVATPLPAQPGTLRSAPSPPEHPRSMPGHASDPVRSTSAVVAAAAAPSIEQPHSLTPEAGASPDAVAAVTPQPVTPHVVTPAPAVAAPSVGGGVVWGRPPPTRQVGPGRAVGTSSAPAGFADRLGGLILDGIIVGVAQLPVVAATYGLLFLVGQLSTADPSTCTSLTMTGSGRVIGVGCQPDNVAVVYAILAGYLLASLWIWWRLVPGRMARRGSSVGMGLARLHIDDARLGGRIGRLQALWRAILASVLPQLLSLPVLLALTAAVGDGESDEMVVPVVAGLAVLSIVAYALPWLWFFWDRRHQTLYDKFSRTVVLGPDAPTEPWSVVALVLGIVCLAIWILAPVAIVVGSMGIRRQDDVRTPTRGRGAARAGQVLGWIGTLLLITLAVLVAVVVIRS